MGEILGINMGLLPCTNASAPNVCVEASMLGFLPKRTLVGIGKDGF